MPDPVDTEILVAGTGPVGLSAAMALAARGRSVILCGPDVSADDMRTTALMQPSLDQMDALGVGKALRETGQPLKTMRIVDGTSRLVRTGAISFHASEIGAEFFGLNLRNRDLNRTLAEAVAGNDRIDWRKQQVARWDMTETSAQATLADGSTLSTSLVVAADGRNSPARAAAGITVSERRHRQMALVLSFGHSRSHGDVSTEFHTESGPFTQVPLPGNRSSLVWVVAPDMADILMALDDATLGARIEERMQSMLGKVEIDSGRQLYPLTSMRPSRLADRRVILVGEAAHVFPPIGAQGLNLGLRDMRDLVTSVEGAPDPGAESVLARYRRLRAPDVAARSTAVAVLNQSLLTDFLPVQIARSLSVGLLSGLAPLRGFLVREGMEPGSGFAALRSRKKVGGQHA